MHVLLVKMRHSVPLQLTLLVLLASVMLFPMLSAQSLLDTEETRFALQAREMIETGDWVVPRWSHRPLGTKPPLFIWMIALLSKAVGQVNEWTARLPAAAAALGTVLLVYAVGFRFFGRWAGFLSGLVLSTSYLFWSTGRMAKSDMPLTFFVTASLTCLFCGTETKQRSALWLLAAFAASGLGVLSKGPVGLALPALVGFLYLTYCRRWGAFPWWSYPAGVILFGVVVLPWYAFYGQAAGSQYLWKMLFKENVVRYVDTFSHKNPFYFYFEYFPPNFLPWMGFMLLGLLYGATRAWKRREAGCVIFLWWAATFLFFTLSTSKRPVYILPVFPPAALLTGWFLAAEILNFDPTKRRRWYWWGRLSLQLTFAGIIVGGFVFPAWAALVDPTLLTQALLAGIGLVLVGATCLWFERKRSIGQSVALVVGGILVIHLASIWSVTPIVESRRSPAPGATEILRRARGGHVLAFGFPYASLSFYGLNQKDGVEGDRREVFYTGDLKVVRHFLHDLQAPAYVVVRQKVFGQLPKDIRAQARVVISDLLYGGGRKRVVLLANSRSQDSTDRHPGDVAKTP